MKEPAVPETGVTPDGPIHLLDYWRVLVRRRHVALSCVGIVLVVGLVLTFVATPQYRATTTLQIERKGPDILTYEDVVNVDPSFAGYQDFYQTQYKILQSRAVLSITADRIDLVNRPEYANRRRPPIQRLLRWARSFVDAADHAEDPTAAAIEFLEEGLSVAPVRNSHLVKVSFTDRDAALARDISNAVADAYQEFSLESRYTATAQASEFLTKQVAQLQAEIADKERKLQQYSAQKEILALRDETQDITSQALAELNAEYVRAKGRLAVAEARFKSVRDATADSLPEVLQSPLINSLKQQYAEVERRHSQMAERFRPDWPTMRQVRDELEQAGERLRLETENIARQVRSVTEADHERALAEVQSLARRVEEQKTEVQRVSLDAIEIASLRAEIETQRSFLEDLVNRQSQTAVSDRLRDTRASNIRTVDRAQLPGDPVKPRKLFNIVTSLMLGVFLGVALALTVDHLDNTVKNEQDVERIAGVPALGHIPYFQPLQAVAGNGVEAVSSEIEDPLGRSSHFDARSIFAEAFKNLRTSIQLASPDHPPRLIVVTSCEPADGKSTISSNLAIVLTQMGRRVLLVDADLRRPRLHKMLGVPNGEGLSTLITGNASFDDVLQATEVPGLSVIASGPIPPNPSELLESTSLQSLLARLQNDGHFDHVIFDSPPVVQVADSVILATRTDATLVVIRAGKTAREALAHGAARLRQARVHVAGAVLNAVEEQAGYHYGRHKYYRRSDDELGDGGSVLGRFRKRRHSA